MTFGRLALQASPHCGEVFKPLPPSLATPLSLLQETRVPERGHIVLIPHLNMNQPHRQPQHPLAPYFPSVPLMLEGQVLVEGASESMRGNISMQFLDSYMWGPVEFTAVESDATSV